MSLYAIEDRETLHRYLYAAMQLEHATIPVYLTALYSIKPGTNSEAFHIIRAVAVEEMLHLTLVANVMNATGGKVDLNTPGFVPPFPCYLPDGEDDFQVSCRKFSKEAINTFLQIERPADLDPGEPPVIHRPRKALGLNAGRPHHEGEAHFFSIGQFYHAVGEGLKKLHAEMGDELFNGDPAWQIGPEYYYSGGNDLVPVTDMKSALRALDIIAEQGEGVTGHIFDEDGEIAHYYRFQQLILGKYYQEGDAPNQPSGSDVEVDWDAVFPVKTDAKIEMYPEGSDARTKAEAFNASYADFLSMLTTAFNGQPNLFIDAVGGMFQLKELFFQLMRMPLADGENAAPTFEINPA